MFMTSQKNPRWSRRESPRRNPKTWRKSWPGPQREKGWVPRGCQGGAKEVPRGCQGLNKKGKWRWEWPTHYNIYIYWYISRGWYCGYIYIYVSCNSSCSILEIMKMGWNPVVFGSTCHIRRSRIVDFPWKRTEVSVMRGPKLPGGPAIGFWKMVPLNPLICHFIQWEFQDPKMEVLYHIRPYFVGIFPCIGLI